MSERVTLMIEKEILKKLRVLHSKKIAKSLTYVSFSSVVNDELRKAAKLRDSR